MKKWLLFALKLVLTAACLWWALRGENFRDSILARPSELGWQWLVPGIALAGVTVFLTALRLWLLLAAAGVRVSLWRATELTLIGNLFNLAAVGGLGGDAARIILLIRDHPERKMAVTMTVMFDHLVGFVAMALVFFMLTAGRFDALASQSVETKAIMRFAWVFFIGGMLFVTTLFVLSYPSVHARIHGRAKEGRFAFLRRFPEIYDMYRKDWPRALTSLLVAIVMLPIFYATTWCGARAAGSEVGLEPVLVAMPVSDMLGALPLSIAGLGVREASLKVLMEDLTGMAPDIAVAAGLIGFFCSLVWALVGGLLFLNPRDRVKVSEIKELNAGSHV
ncbi:lysylphosphatidylglycerol synthase transmembrane domain-containing protein [Haloferula sp. A504]|uniref:lysylphosphatidylglycerol synthase transmembrane domain-containing protein n=1 Tax=Haloferula sp. A504 TaxID=3373601 RepID=UPI0031C4468F|nr:flippase-like domain-containing protein [Verrucomicrobiaceae bacterium E54]